MHCQLIKGFAQPLPRPSRRFSPPAELVGLHWHFYGLPGHSYHITFTVECGTRLKEFPIAYNTAGESSMRCEGVQDWCVYFVPQVTLPEYKHYLLSVRVEQEGV